MPRSVVVAALVLACGNLIAGAASADTPQKRHIEPFAPSANPKRLTDPR